MANSIQILSDLTVTGPAVPFRMSLGRQVIEQTGKRVKDLVVNIGTSEVTVPIDDIGTPGIVALINSDTTNYVRWGIATTAYTGRILAGEIVNPFRIEPGVQDLYLIADTAACDVRIIVLEA
jgi:hypothetical protein